MLRLGRLQRGSYPMKGNTLTSEKLSVVVRVDVDGEQIQIAATGRVTLTSLQGLYPVVQRTKTLRSGLDVRMDLSEDTVDPDALYELQLYAGLCEIPGLLSPEKSNVTALPSRAPRLTTAAA